MENLDGPRVHRRLSQEGWLQGRVLQIRQGGAHLPNQPVASAIPSFQARPRYLAVAGFSASARRLANRGDTTPHVAPRRTQASHNATQPNRRATAPQAHCAFMLLFPFAAGSFGCEA